MYMSFIFLILCILVFFVFCFVMYIAKDIATNGFLLVNSQSHPDYANKYIICHNFIY